MIQDLTDIVINSAAAERIFGMFTTNVDPTSADVFWSLTATTEDDPDTPNQEQGSWRTYSPVTGIVTTDSPTIGGTGSIADITKPEGRYYAWVTWTINSDVVVKKLPRVVVIE